MKFIFKIHCCACNKFSVFWEKKCFMSDSWQQLIFSDLSFRWKIGYQQSYSWGLSPLSENPINLELIL